MPRPCIRRPLPVDLEILERRTLLSGTGSLTPIVAFDGTNGSRPTAIVVDSSKNLFGVTSATAPTSTTTGPGNLFEIPAGTSTLNVLTSFPDGVAGNSLIIDISDNLFGTTVGGGANNTGYIFEVAHGSTTITTLASFPPLPSTVTAGAGNQVVTDVDSDGDLFGIDANRNPFELAQGATAITSLDSSLLPNASDGVTDLRLASDNSLLGTTLSGGATGDGTIFGIAPGTTTLNTLASFDAATTGAQPVGITFHRSTDDLVGFTATGGAHGGGTVFKLTIGSDAITTVASFSDATGTTPASRPFYDKDGDLLGLTKAGGANGAGTFFDIPAGTGTLNDVADATAADVILPNVSTIGADSADQAERDADGNGFFIMLGAASPQGQSNSGSGASGVSGTIYNGKLGNETSGSGGSPPLSVSAVTGKVPTSFVAGQKATATVQVSIEDTTAAPVSGNVSIALFVSPDGTLGAATQIGKTTTKKLVLKSQQSRSVPVRITSFPNVAAGTYQIVAQVTDASNNTSTMAGPSLTIAPPFVQTVVSAVTPQSTSVTRGKKTGLSFTLTDSGNTAVAGTANLAISTSADPSGASAQTVVTVPVKVKLKAGAKKTMKVKFTLPPGAATGPAYLAVSLDVGTLGDTNAADGNSVSSTAVTIS